MGPRIVLLGASGFVGSAVLRELAAQGLGAELLAHRTSPGDWPLGTNVHHGGMTALPKALLPQSPHVVIHCASKQVDADGTGFAVNLQGIQQLSEHIAANGHTRAVLFVSSCSVYGDGPQRGVREDEPLRPETALARSRADCEQRLAAMARDGLCRVEVFRPRFVLGRGDRHVLPGLAKLFRKGWSLGTGRQRFSVIDVDDFARILVARATRALKGGEGLAFEAFNVGYERPVSMLEIEHSLHAQLADAPPRRRIPAPHALLGLLKRLPIAALRQAAHRLGLLGLDHYGDVSRLQARLDAPWLRLDPREALRRAAQSLQPEAVR